MISKFPTIAVLIIFILDRNFSHGMDLVSSLSGQSRSSPLFSESTNKMPSITTKWGPKKTGRKNGAGKNDGVDSGGGTDSMKDAGLSCGLGQKGYDDPFLGKVELTESDCAPRSPKNTCPREDACCQPQPPKNVLNRLMFFHPEGSDSVDVNWMDEEVPEQYFDGCDSFIYVIHGFLEDYHTTACLKSTVETYQSMGNCVFFVEWSRGNKLSYQQAATNVQTTGRIVAFTAHNWDILEKVKLVVGFSLGGQSIGVAGKFMKELTGGRTFKHCHATDPAGPLFDGCSKRITLNPDDCEIVQAIHTSAMRDEKAISGTEFTGYGTAMKSGKCDYWVNCGYPEDQTPCLETNKINLPETLSSDGGEISRQFSEQQVWRHHRACLMYNAHLQGIYNFDTTTAKCPGCANKKHAIDKELGRCYDDSNPFGEKFIVDNPCTRKSDYYVYVSKEKGLNLCRLDDKRKSME